eukprot:TRINITY_DN67158_c4_g3_i2.p1 TRINITY_DN67158_c4_g3~~TRINITY_DN67158_c4_g3_i2.p1  ORF type:complete len:585 (+),score=73.17 TRINITY_DN67158_c4_g3_i2:66-1820(+)
MISQLLTLCLLVAWAGHVCSTTTATMHIFNQLTSSQDPLKLSARTAEVGSWSATSPKKGAMIEYGSLMTWQLSSTGATVEGILDLTSSAGNAVVTCAIPSDRTKMPDCKATLSGELGTISTFAENVNGSTSNIVFFVNICYDSSGCELKKSTARLAEAAPGTGNGKTYKATVCMMNELDYEHPLNVTTALGFTGQVQKGWKPSLVSKGMLNCLSFTNTPQNNSPTGVSGLVVYRHATEEGVFVFYVNVPTYTLPYYAHYIEQNSYTVEMYPGQEEGETVYVVKYCSSCSSDTKAQYPFPAPPGGLGNYTVSVVVLNQLTSSKQELNVSLAMAEIGQLEGGAKALAPIKFGELGTYTFTRNVKNYDRQHAIVGTIFFTSTAGQAELAIDVPLTGLPTYSTYVSGEIGVVWVSLVTEVNNSPRHIQYIARVCYDGSCESSSPAKPPAVLPPGPKVANWDGTVVIYNKFSSTSVEVTNIFPTAGSLSGSKFPSKITGGLLGTWKMKNMVKSGDGLGLGVVIEITTSSGEQAEVVVRAHTYKPAKFFTYTSGGLTAAVALCGNTSPTTYNLLMHIAVCDDSCNPPPCF